MLLRVNDTDALENVQNDTIFQQISTDKRLIGTRRGRSRLSDVRLKTMSVRKTVEKPNGAVMITMGLKGRRKQERHALTAEKKAQKANMRKIGACLPCRFSAKQVSRTARSHFHAFQNFWQCKRLDSTSICERCSARHVNWTWSPCLLPVSLDFSTLFSKFTGTYIQS